MKPIIYLLTAAVGFTFLTSFSSKISDESPRLTAGEHLRVIPVKDSKAFPGATLKIRDIQTIEMTAPDSVLFKVTYNVANFTLTECTEDPNTHQMANSQEGQHIHFIMDNHPYIPLYKPEHEMKLKKGTEHYLMSFLSRSYHESIKENDGFVLNHFKITQDGKYQELAMPKAPMLFYSRPKGEYVGKDTQAILLDFYLLNTQLSEKGNRVKVEINGKSFMLKHWQPYKIEGLPLGENKIKLTLIDASGHPLKGENTSVERTIILKE